MAIGVVLNLSWLLVVPLGCLYPSFYTQGGRGYKEGNWVSYNMIPIRTLSLLGYFTYILIDIIIYALGSVPWSSRIFWMVGRVIADPSLGLLSPCRVVPLVPILVSSPRVLSMWVDAGWSRSSLSVTNLSSTKFHEPSSLAWNCWVLFRRVDRIGTPIRCSPDARIKSFGEFNLGV
jgi:hypothetical protein